MPTCATLILQLLYATGTCFQLLYYFVVSISISQLFLDVSQFHSRCTLHTTTNVSCVKLHVQAPRLAVHSEPSNTFAADPSYCEMGIFPCQHPRCPRVGLCCQEATLREIHGFPSFCHIEMYLVPRCLYPCVDHENKSVERRQSVING